MVSRRSLCPVARFRPWRLIHPAKRYVWVCAIPSINRLSVTTERVTGIELGSALAEVGRAEWSHFDNIAIVSGDVETLDLQPKSFDAVTAFTCFHWLDPDTRAGRAATPFSRPRKPGVHHGMYGSFAGLMGATANEIIVHVQPIHLWVQSHGSLGPVLVV